MPLAYHTAAELFQGISESEAQKVARLCAERRYRKGATIFSKDDSADSLYIVKDGRVRLLSLSDKGTETILHILTQGAIFGELLLSEEKRALTAVAGTDVLVTVIPKGSLVELLSSIPTVSKNFIRLLSKRLAKVEKEFADSGHTWSYHRLSKVLLRLCEEHGQETRKGTVIPLRLTHEDLANLIGTTRETVTTQLNRFRRKGLIEREGRFLLVNRQRLSDFLQSA
ncbi:MAG TPA: Crp/Fnr family transcriptional regulator [Candidatus Deferrimicrobiaceae bacterium]|jgi:CRP-like cAMP-binding protein|nr:Crp/Fnr family transcriptional regulator [Candidatus Deferrimicrobiaceae bacterium]